MVQAALGTAIAGLGVGARALKSQTHGGASRVDPPASVVPFMAATKDKKTLKAIKCEADKDRLMYLISQPEIVGLLVTLGGIFAAQNIRFTQDNTSNEAAQAAATSAAIIMGMGHAGVGDLTTAVFAGLGGVASLLSGVNIGDVIPSESELGNAVIEGGLKGIFPLYGLFKSVKRLV